MVGAGMTKDKSRTLPVPPVPVSVVIPWEVWSRVDRKRIDIDRVCTNAIRMAVEIIEDDDQFSRDQV
jgi:hypothetical protein